MLIILLSAIRKCRYSIITDFISDYCGRSKTFIVALVVIAVWLISGPIFAYSDTWQLVINTGTTIVTFLMMFILQNTHNRDVKDIHTKLDRLLEKDKE